MKKRARTPDAEAKGTAAKEVQAYLDAVPEPGRSTLEKLRGMIRSVVPDAEEVISYRMPTFKRTGMLVSYAAFADHCSLFLLSPEVLARHQAELARYETAKGTIRFPVDKPLPATLVRRLVKARIAENEARAQARAKRSKP